MIDMSYREGNKVVNLKQTNEYEVTVGQVGIITFVDISDSYLTYKVQWDNVGHSVWWENADLSPYTVDDDMECGWKTRALRAERQLKELKEALKTLSEG